MTEPDESISASHAPCGAPVVRGILLVDQYTPRSDRFRATSLPGHLLHLVCSGRVVQEVSGREYEIERGSVIWYHEDELVVGRIVEQPWTFYTVNFVAPDLPPPPYDQRVRTAGPGLEPKFRALLDAWRAAGQQRFERELAVHARLSDLLAEVLPLFNHGFAGTEAASLWWELERMIRQDLTCRYGLADLSAACGRSPSTINRACQEALGLTPMKRVKDVKMSFARGLLQRSTASVTEIAARVGYDRIHEFSRDYRKQFGRPPSAERRAVRER